VPQAPQVTGEKNHGACSTGDSAPWRAAPVLAVLALLVAPSAPLVWADPAADDVAEPPAPSAGGPVASSPPAVSTFPDGWPLAVAASNESQVPMAPIVTPNQEVGTRDVIVGGTFTGSLRKSGGTVPVSGTLEVGYQIDCPSPRVRPSETQIGTWSGPITLLAHRSGRHRSCNGPVPNVRRCARRTPNNSPRFSATLTNARHGAQQAASRWRAKPPRRAAHNLPKLARRHARNANSARRRASARSSRAGVRRRARDFGPPAKSFEFPAARFTARVRLPRSAAVRGDRRMRRMWTMAGRLVLPHRTAR
jgi:hypothetical protein